MISLRNPIKEIATSFSEHETPTILSKIWTSYLESATPQDYLCLYINVPFCPQHCSFCEYPSKVCHRGIDDRYIDRLEERFKEASQVFNQYPISVIMFGGGSPSLLSAKQLQRILDMISQYWTIDLNPMYERGFELHPSQISDDHLQVLQNSIINRISMGIQSFDRQVLKAENRAFVPMHRIAEIYDALRETVLVTNTDLLAGLRHQTADILIQDVQQLLLLMPQIITIYELNPIWKHRADKDHITSMLHALYQSLKSLRNNELYTYVGTTPDGFQHCNRLYKNDAVSFTRDYSPVPTGFNNIIGFSLDDSSTFSQHTWSLFHPLNVAYEMKGRKLYVYSMTRAAETDRPFWQDAFKLRKEIL